MNCKVCGSQVSLDDAHCKVCGALLEEKRTEPTGAEGENHPRDLVSSDCDREVIKGDEPMEEESGWNTLVFPKPQDVIIEEEKAISISYDDYKLGRLFLFSQENEKIQKILDEEYERIRNLNTQRTEEIPLWKNPQETFQLTRDTIPINPKEIIKAAERSRIETEQMPEKEDGDIPQAQTEQMPEKEDGDIPLAQTEQVPEKENGNIPEAEGESVKEREAENLKQEHGQKSGKPKKVLLIVFVFLLGVAITVIGIKYLQSDLVNNIIGERKGTISENGGFSKPVMNKNLLIERAWNSNQNLNIRDISSNEALEFSHGRDYGVDGINLSRPIGNNTWVMGEGDQPRYFDQEVVRTLIAFDSQWIDYINKGNETVMAMIRQDSGAYEKLIPQDWEGKPGKIMLKLDIGEIRRWKNSFYVWTYEQLLIKGEEDSIINTFKIYHIDIVGKQMQIADYTEY
ncbi:MAG: hypothetical protein ACOX4U_04250 [Anaerovoracaceae bacterium]